MMELCISCFKEIGKEEICEYCGAVQKLTPKEAFHIHPRTVLNGRYMIGSVVGYGGFGVTYKALDMRLNEIVAIKEYFPAGLVNRVPGETEVIMYPGEKGERFLEGKEKFLNEAKNTAKFSNNPNIVNVFDFFEFNNTAYIVMEFLEGVSLKQYIKQNGGKLDVQSSLEIINRVVQGLKDVHKAGIVHRDISPDNIFLTSNNKVKIIDFGAARFSSENQESTFSIVLKQGYAPPEQYRNKSKQGAFTDIYAVGAMLYAMLTGEIPEESVDRQIDDTLAVPSSLEPSVPQYLDKVIMKAMALKSELRFQNMEQFAEALSGKKSVMLPEEELRKKKKTRTLSFAAIGAVIAVCICVGVIFKVVTQDVNLNHYIKEDSEVEIWVPFDEANNSYEETKKIYDEIYSGLISELEDNTDKNRLKAALEIDIQYIPESEYAERLKKAELAGELPEVYRSDLAAKGNCNIIGTDLSWIRKKIIKKDYALYEKSEKCANELPISVETNVLYLNERYNTDDSLTYVSSVDSILKVDTGDKSVVPLVINPDCPVFYSDNQEQIASINKSDEKDYAINKFISGKSVFYIGKISELPKIKNSSLKWYTLNCVSSADNGTFSEVWAVNDTADNSLKYASMYVLSYLLTEEAQEIMYIDNDSFIPLNKNTLDVYIYETHSNDSIGSFSGIVENASYDY